MNILDILKARKLGYQTLHNTTDMLLAKKVSGGSYEDVTVSGNPISITGAKGGLAKALTVDMLPIQDLNGYDSPWVGGGGKNKLNYDSWKTVSVTKGSAVFENNGITLTATETDCYTDYTSAIYPKNARVPVSEGEIITLSWDFNSDETNIAGYVYIFGNGSASYLVRADKNEKTSSYTVPSGITYVTFRVGTYTQNTTIHYKNLMIRKSGDSTWQPYSNICPISGRTQTVVKRCGKNLFDKSRITTQTATTIDYARTNGGLLLKGGITYTLSIGKSISLMGIYGYGGEIESDNRIAYTSSSSTLTFTLADTTLVFIRFYNNTASGGISESDVNTIQLEVGSTATPYEAYTEADTTIPFNQTVYGGEVDVTSGGTSVNYDIVDLGTLNWGYNSNYNFFYTIVSNIKSKTNKLTASIYEGISTKLPSQMADVGNNTVCTRNFDGNQIQIKDTRFVSESDFKSAVSGVMLCYEKTTPTTLASPAASISLLKGNNTLSTSGDNMTVTYKGKGISSLQSGLSMMSPELTDMAEEDD